jgi:amino acid efflux transporter
MSIKSPVAPCASPVAPCAPAGIGTDTAGRATLSTPRGAALYIGALLGPGLLLLPGLAAAEAGPASILAWLGLLALSGLFAMVFTALGRAYPAAGGVSGYTAAGLGRPAGVAAGACFLGGDGSVIAAIVAVVLTLGTTNAYLTGAVTMARDLARSPAPSRSGRPFLALIAMAGAALLGLYGAGLVTTTQLVSLPTALFLTAYLGCTLSGSRTLRGAGRGCATAALVAVIVLLAFCGWALAFAAVVTGTALLTSGRHLRPSRRT